MNPYIQICGKTFGTYGLCVLAGIVLAIFCVWRKSRKHGLLIEDIFIVSGTTLLGTMLCGGGLYIAVTYPLNQIVDSMKNGDFRFLSGGSVFYGGLIGGILGALIGIRIAKVSGDLIEHAVVPYVPLGHAVGRIGCLMAGCCHGVEYDGPLAVYYPHSVQALPPQQGYFPVQLLESALNVCICCFLIRVGKHCKTRGQLLSIYGITYGIIRFGLEMLRGDKVRGEWNNFSTSQWISLVLILISTLWLTHTKQNKAIIPL